MFYLILCFCSELHCCSLICTLICTLPRYCLAMSDAEQGDPTPSVEPAAGEVEEESQVVVPAPPAVPGVVLTPAVPAKGSRSAQADTPVRLGANKDQWLFKDKRVPLEQLEFDLPVKVKFDRCQLTCSANEGTR